MRLVFLTVIPSPYQRQLFAAMQASDAMEARVFYFARSEHNRAWHVPDLRPYETVLEGRTVRLGGRSVHWNPGTLRRLRAEAADLVVVSDYSAPAAQLAMRALARWDAPFVFWGEVPGFSQLGPVGAFLRRQMQRPLAAADAIAAIGSVAAESYRALFPGKPVFTIPYYCDLAPFQAARAGLGGAGGHNAGGGTVDILFSGQLIPRKGVDLLLEAFAGVARRHPAARLLILGDGPERAQYAQAVPADLAGRVLFLGHKQPAELPGVFARADLFCLPSRHDGWGVVVNEALGAGLPLVLSDAVGAGRDLVEPGRNGLIFPSEDVAALAGALERVVGDAGLRQRMAEASRGMAERWTLAEGVANWQRAAEAVLAARGR